jgi:hypothetical protein
MASYLREENLDTPSQCESVRFPVVCTENLNPDVVVMKSAKDPAGATEVALTRCFPRNLCHTGSGT